MTLLWVLRVPAYAADVPVPPDINVTVDNKGVEDRLDSIDGYIKSLPLEVPVSLLSSFIQDRDYGIHYFAYRINSGRYVIYLCDSITFTRTVLSTTVDLSGISSLYVLSLTDSEWGFSAVTSPPPTFSLSPLPSLYFSDAPNEPHLVEETDSYEVQALFILALGSICFYFMRRFSSSLRL